MAKKRKDTKAPNIQNFLNQLALISGYKLTRTKALEKMLCVKCGKEAKNFSDETSKKEYNLSALCQQCQNAFFFQIGTSSDG